MTGWEIFGRLAIIAVVMVFALAVFVLAFEIARDRRGVLRVVYMVIGCANMCLAGLLAAFVWHAP